MNPHYHPYAELSSPHPPSPDNNNYASLSVGHHHNGHVPAMNPIEGHQQGFHHINNNSIPSKHCAGCTGKIVERYFLQALDRFWHNSCLKCSCCGVMLADIGSSCYTRSGMVLCKADYSRLFGCPGSCSGCGENIPGNEMVMKTTSQGGNQQPSNQSNNQNQHSPIQHHVFHIKCFRCSKCGSVLMHGDRYYMLAGSLVCEQDWHKLIKTSSTNSGTTPPVRKGKVGRPRRSRD